VTPKPGISKYFIALVPPSPVLEQAQQWKEYFKVEFNSKAALNSPPHITLHMPFEWKMAKENLLMEQLMEFAQSQKPFHVELKNFGCFDPRVIFIQVVENKELQTLQSALTRFCKTELNLFNANRLDQPYHPHLTVAFRDLKKILFSKAWEFVRNLNFNAQFTCRELVLLKHDGKVWQLAKSFPLGKSKLVSIF
jgi:2'-5' RNA ligase